MSNLIMQGSISILIVALGYLFYKITYNKAYSKGSSNRYQILCEMYGKDWTTELTKLREKENEYNSTLFQDPKKTQFYLGELLHHLGEEIKGNSIQLYNLSEKEGEAISQIGLIFRSYQHYSESEVEEYKNRVQKLLNLPENYNINRVFEALFTSDWEWRLKETREQLQKS